MHIYGHNLYGAKDSPSKALTALMVELELMTLALQKLKPTVRLEKEIVAEEVLLLTTAVETTTIVFIIIIIINLIT